MLTLSTPPSHDADFHDAMMPPCHYFDADAMLPCHAAAALMMMRAVDAAMILRRRCHDAMLLMMLRYALMAPMPCRFRYAAAAAFISLYAIFYADMLIMRHDDAAAALMMPCRFRRHADADAALLSDICHCRASAAATPPPCAMTLCRYAEMLRHAVAMMLPFRHATLPLPFYLRYY